MKINVEMEYDKEMHMGQKKYVFERLTPNDKVDISVYDEAIEFVFENSDVTNIAISGAYGAGKSSVIESYKKKHADKKFMHISLAHFKTSDIQDGKDKIDEVMIEGKILNQLIHQIPVSKIPQTNFRVKKEVSKIQIISIAIRLYALIGSIAFILFSSKIQGFIKKLPKSNLKNVLYHVTDKNAVVIAAGVFLVTAFICVYDIVKLQGYKRLFHKVTVQGNSIEIFEDKDDSYFDKYLNEVLYIFEQVDVDVIVFEDIDRFNSNIIFERLREVNNLTNVQKYNKFIKYSNKKVLKNVVKLVNKISKKVLHKEVVQYKPIRFFYLLRDDIFATKDRTKFFDYIIPIIPVVDSSNSYDQLIRHLKRGNIYKEFDSSFLQRLSLYIDDMRTLKNICNELIVYINRLNNTDLNWNKMLAMIVYKNIFPRDFCDFQLNRGYVYEVFQRKDMLVERNIKKLKNEIQFLEEETEDVDYEKEIFELDRQIPIVRTKLLSELITRENADTVFMIKSVNPIGEENEYEEIKSNDYFELLKFLISNGYIDETYSDYMTYFYEDSLSVQDKVFLRKVTDKKGADYDYKLKDVNKVLSSSILRVIDFYEEETLNFDLLNGLLRNQQKSKYQECLFALIKQIRNKKYFDFVSKFYDSQKFDVLFIRKLNEQYPDFFSYVELNKELPAEQIKRFSLDTIRLSDEKVIQNVNIDNCLTNYISNQDDYLNIEKPDVEKLISRFDFLDVRFKKIAYDKSDIDLFTGVYENNLYELTFENIKLMIDSKYKENDLYDIEHRNYTIIQKEPESPLALYIAENMERYVNELLKNCGDVVEDSEECAIELINSSSISEEEKEKYVEFLTTIISDISKIENKKLWGNMLIKGIAEKTVSNIIYYYEEYSLDTILVEFINQCNEDMDYSIIEKDFGNEIAGEFFEKVVINNDINIEKYEKILCGMEYVFDFYEFDEISDDRMSILIKNHIIEMDEKGLEYIRNYYNDHILMYINYNIEEYINIISTDNFDYEEMLHILDMDIDDDDKISLLRLTGSSISVIGKNYSNCVIAYIIKNNFDACDRNELYENYSKYDKSIQEAIYVVASSEVDDIVSDSSVILDGTLLSEILQNEECRIDDRIDLWAKALPSLDEEKCKKHFDELGFPGLKKIFTKKNNFTRTYDKNSCTTYIFEELKKNGWIFDYYEKDDDSEKYIVVKNKTRMKKRT